MRQSSLLLVLSTLIVATPSAAQVVVNEVSASNWSHRPDELGDFEDYIELYNTGANPVDISGWFLSDSQNNNMKYAFPAGTTIAGNGHLLAYCSGRNTVSGGNYHTSFKLNQTQSERAVLSGPDGTIVDNFQLALRTKADHSLGRTTDGSANWALFTTPTPGAANTGASAYYAQTPAFSQAPGTFGGPISLVLSTSEANVTIRYTLDGTTPSGTSTAYTAPIAINATTVVRAIAIPNNGTTPPSFVETNTYFIGTTHAVSILSISGDQLPVLLGGTQIEPLGTLEFFDAQGAFKGETSGDFNKHGNDSWAYPQRGLDYIGRDQFGQNDALYFEVFRTKNRAQFQRLILKAGASDNYPFEPGGAHIRDAFVQALSHESQLYLDERTYEPCVLYVNGQYWGVYEIREKVDDSDFTDHYYDQSENDLYMLKTWGTTWEEYGQGQALNDWTALRNFINTNNMGDPGAFAYVESQYNWKSLVDYFVLNSYIVSKDWLNWNTGWWRGMNPLGDGRRWRYILWDMDACFGHYTNFTSVPNTDPDADPCQAESLPNPGGQGHTLILEKLMDENQMVREYYINRYADLGNTVFSCAHMNHFLDSLVALIAPEMPGHIARWGGTVAGWEANVQAIRDFMDERCVVIQEGMVDCYELEGPFPLMFDVEPAGAGTIRINSVTPEVYPYQGVYYGGINTTLQATSTPGWEFSHWTTRNHLLVPSMTDSLVTLDLVTSDTLIAHFRPPIRYNVVLMVEPPGTAEITFSNIRYQSLPAIAQVSPDAQDTARVHPAMYYDFVRWEVRRNTPDFNDTTALVLPITIFEPDTIIAHLRPQQYVYFTPNAFSPDGDGLNDTWRPVNNVLDLEKYELLVYDRWGRIVFTTTDPYQEWDGTFGGKRLPSAVYAYKARMRNAITNERHEAAGHVTIIR